MPIKTLCLILCLAPFLTACEKLEQDSSNNGFEDITLQARLDFKHTSGVEGQYLLPEIMGSGGALFDFDNDGDLDIYLVNGGNRRNDQDDSANKLFQRNTDGLYQDVTKNPRAR
ncbi:MAG: hypothetical protein CM1200mP9_06080 [Gammaproteobacteria bacterium]|nr:MAG: hypothetical protein CM1200mP9_06080 [Gammaproteobacteria bacterium]